MIITDHFKEGGQCFSSHDKDSWICRRSVAPVINCNKKMSRKFLLLLKNHRCAEETPSNELSLSAQKRGQNNKKGSQKLKVMDFSNPIINFYIFHLADPGQKIDFRWKSVALSSFLPLALAYRWDESARRPVLSPLIKSNWTAIQFVFLFWRFWRKKLKRC